MAFVVDNSVVVGWYFSSQRADYSEAVRERLLTETAHVPALWVLEFSNVLRKAVLSRKIDIAVAEEIAELQAELPWVVHEGPVAPLDNLRLALRHGLSSYDGAYLQLAIELKLPLATRDEPLRAAAQAAGVGVAA
jgi:predicted nucleic acid-binding protein